MKKIQTIVTNPHCVHRLKMISLQLGVCGGFRVCYNILERSLKAFTPPHKPRTCSAKSLTRRPFISVSFTSALAFDLFILIFFWVKHRVPDLFAVGTSLYK